MQQSASIQDCPKSFHPEKNLFLGCLTCNSSVSNLFRGDNSGLTLLEVLLVVAIIGLLSGIATLTWAQLLPGYQLKSAVSQLYSTMQLGRTEAIRRGEACVMTFDLAAEEYRLFVDLVNPTFFQFDPGDVEIAHFSLSEGAQVEFVDPGVTFGMNGRGLPAVVFLKRGYIKNPNGSLGNRRVTLKNSLGEKKAVISYWSGRLRIE